MFAIPQIQSAKTVADKTTTIPIINGKKDFLYSALSSVLPIINLTPKIVITFLFLLSETSFLNENIFCIIKLPKIIFFKSKTFRES